MRGETNRVEDLALKRVVVAGAGRLEEREFILLWFKGRVVDYTLHRQTHKILAGSLTYPKEWEEYWCFEKQPGQEVWLVSDIREY
jgi:predicted lipid-binding transport protein (Tim44 family)